MWDLLAGMKSLVYTWRSWTCNSLLNPWTCNPQATSLWLSMSVYWTALTEASHLVQRPGESWVTLCAKKSICENLYVGVWCQWHKNWNNTRCSRGVSCQCGWHELPLSHFLQMVNHFDISLAPSFLSMSNQVGWLRPHTVHVCLLLHSLLVWPVTWKITFQVQHFSPAGKDFVANQCHKRYLPVFKL